METAANELNLTRHGTPDYHDRWNLTRHGTPDYHDDGTVGCTDLRKLRLPTMYRFTGA